MIPLPPSYDALQREVMDLRSIVISQAHMDQRLVDEVMALRKRIDKLEREAEARDKTKHYPPVKPLRPVNFKTLGKRIEEDDGA